MVFLSRIYTKTGDLGETSLGDGKRVSKDDVRVAAYGDVDELNAVLGLVVTSCPDSPDRDLLRTILNDLFDVGADLCVPIDPAKSAAEGDTAVPDDGRLRITSREYERLENAIDAHNENLLPLRSFVLPGGSQASAWLHLARTVCRRAERSVVTLQQKEAVNPHVLIYLNRLSDYLFVLARVANSNGRDDVLWEPGRSQKS